MSDNIEYNQETVTSGITLLDIWLQIKKHFVFLVSSLLVGIILGVGYTFAIQKVEYTAHASVAVTSDITSGSEQSAYQYALTVLKTYKEFVETKKIRDKVESHFKETAGEVPWYTLEVKTGDTLFVYISVVSNNSRDAKELVKQYVEVSTDEAINMQDTLFKKINITLIEPAYGGGATRHTSRNIAVGLAIGLVVGIIYFIIAFLLDNTYKRDEEIFADLKLKSLGALPTEEQLFDD
jgi:capsular polysaccharide biosynthesis protein